MYREGFLFSSPEKTISTGVELILVVELRSQEKAVSISQRGATCQVGQIWGGWVKEDKTLNPSGLRCREAHSPGHSLILSLT